MQRVIRGRVTVDGNEIAVIGKGLVVLIAVKRGDTRRDVEYLADKISNLRIFEDEAGKMNLSLMDTGGQVLAVSQFTLYGDVRKGRRPGFTEAARPDEGREMFDEVVENIRSKGIPVATGEFGGHMVVEIINDGPCTIILDSQLIF